jgi:hypothetical protein
MMGLSEIQIKFRGNWASTAFEKYVGTGVFMACLPVNGSDINA